MSTAVATVEFVRGESVSYGLRATNPEYDGTETVTCDIKHTTVAKEVPPRVKPVVVSATVDFFPANNGDPAYYLFSLTPEQTEALIPGLYITDAKVVDASGEVSYPNPLCIKIDGSVTA